MRNKTITDEARNLGWKIFYFFQKAQKTSCYFMTYFDCHELAQDVLDGQKEMPFSLDEYKHVMGEKFDFHFKIQNPKTNGASNMNEQAYFVVYNPNSSKPPQVRHADFGAAKAEAERLAGIHAGERFYILQAVGYAKKTSVDYVQLDNIPF